MAEEIIKGPESYPATVITVEPLDNYQLRVKLSDGRSGIFDMSPFLNKGVFKELKDPEYFRQVFVSHDTVTWPHGQDIAPETVAYLLKAEPTLPKKRTWSLGR